MNTASIFRQSAKLFQQQLDDTSKLDGETPPLQISMTDTLAGIEALVRENASAARNQEEYARQYDGLTAKYKAAKERPGGKDKAVL